MGRTTSRAAAILAGALALAAPAAGAWSAGAGGSAAAAARTMPAGNVPSGTAAIGGTVTVTWIASTFAGGAPVPGYVIRRFNSITGAEATVLPACAGIVSGTSCIESGVPIGSWKYSVTPAAGTWRVGQSAQSAAVVVTL